MSFRGRVAFSPAACTSWNLRMRSWGWYFHAWMCCIDCLISEDCRYSFLPPTHVVWIRARHGKSLTKGRQVYKWMVELFFDFSFSALNVTSASNWYPWSSRDQCWAPQLHCQRIQTCLLQHSLVSLNLNEEQETKKASHSLKMRILGVQYSLLWHCCGHLSRLVLMKANQTAMEMRFCFQPGLKLSRPSFVRLHRWMGSSALIFDKSNSLGRLGEISVTLLLQTLLLNFLYFCLLAETRAVGRSSYPRLQIGTHPHH